MGILDGIVSLFKDSDDKKYNFREIVIPKIGETWVNRNPFDKQSVEILDCSGGYVKYLMSSDVEISALVDVFISVYSLETPNSNVYINIHSGATYELIKIGNEKATREGWEKYAIYEDVNGDTWVRPLIEFRENFKKKKYEKKL